MSFLQIIINLVGIVLEAIGHAADKLANIGQGLSEGNNSKQQAGEKAVEQLYSNSDKAVMLLVSQMQLVIIWCGLIIFSFIQGLPLWVPILLTTYGVLAWYSVAEVISDKYIETTTWREYHEAKEQGKFAAKPGAKISADQILIDLEWINPFAWQLEKRHKMTLWGGLILVGFFGQLSPGPLLLMLIVALVWSLRSPLIIYSAAAAETGSKNARDISSNRSRSFGLVLACLVLLVTAGKAGYEIKVDGDGQAIRLNKLTGEITAVHGDELVPVKSDQTLQNLVQSIASEIQSLMPTTSTSNDNHDKAIELNNQAVAYMAAGNYATAIEKLKSAIHLDEQYALAHSNLAIGYDNQGTKFFSEGKIQEAKSMYELAIAADPSEKTAALNLAAVHYLGKRSVSSQPRTRLLKEAGIESKTSVLKEAGMSSQRDWLKEAGVSCTPQQVSKPLQ